MWTDKSRAKYNRDHLRYPSDLTDDEWTYVEPLIPPAKRGGGKRRTDMRVRWKVFRNILPLVHHAIHDRCSANFLFSQNCSPIAPTQDQFSIPRSAKSCPTSKPKSSDAQIVSKGSCRYPSVGSSNVPSLG